jgi:hypothetical protein
VAIGGLALIVAAVWTLWGRHRFTGPVKTISNGQGAIERDSVEGTGIKT